MLEESQEGGPAVEDVEVSGDVDVGEEVLELCDEKATVTLATVIYYNNTSSERAPFPRLSLLTTTTTHTLSPVS